MKRIVSMLLALAMVFTMVTPAFAEAVPLPEAEPQQMTQPAAEGPVPLEAAEDGYTLLNKDPMKASVVGADQKVFDGATNAKWEIRGDNKEIKWNLAEGNTPVRIGRLVYSGGVGNLNKDGGANGNWTDIVISYTAAPEGKDAAAGTWKKVCEGTIGKASPDGNVPATGTLTNYKDVDGLRKAVITFMPVTATALKVQVKQGAGGLVSAREIDVYSVAEDPTEYLYFPLDKTPMKNSAKTGSEQNAMTDDGKGVLAFDGNMNTFWHTNYNHNAVTENKAWIEWNLTADGSAVPVGRLTYLVRLGKNNGPWQSVRVEAKVNNQYQTVYEGVLTVREEGNRREATVNFKPVNATAMKVTVLGSLGGPNNKFACTSEIEVFKAIPKADYHKPADPTATSFEYVELPQNQMMDIEADSEHHNHSEEGSAYYAFDGNNNTLWHEEYDDGNRKYPFLLGWGISSNGEAQLIGKIQYIPRSGGSGANGHWRDVAVYGRIGAPDDEKFAKLHAEATASGNAVEYNMQTYDNGEWVRLAQIKEANFPTINNQNPIDIVFTKPAYVTHLVIKVNKATLNHATAGEIKTFKAVPQEIPPVPDTPTEYNEVPRSEITAIEADSETKPASNNDGPADYAFDHNADTMWHSSYGSNQTNCPHTITWNFKQTKKIGRIEYIKRKNGKNGVWKKVTVEGKEPGKDTWTVLAVDVKQNTDENMTITFAPRDVNAIRVRVDESFGESGENKFATAAEIRTYEPVEVTAVNAKREELRRAYADAVWIPAFDNSSYKKDLYDTYKAALDTAKTFLESSKDDTEAVTTEANEKLTALNNAVAALNQPDAIDPTRLADGAPKGGTSSNNPFPNAGDEGCITDNIRIPGIITLNDGKLAATADARWNHHGDHGNIDGMFSISDDDGATWKYTFPMFFNDSTNLFHNYAATLMDPVVAQDKEGRIYMLIDAFPGGHALHIAAPLKPSNDSGFVMENGKRRLAVYNKPKDQTNDQYVYYVGDFAEENGKKLAPLYAKGTTADAKYYVDGWFNLYDANKNVMVCKQIGSEKYVQQNLFYYNADLHVRSATFLMLVTSDNNGESWSDPQLLDPTNRPTGYSFNGVGPGAGLVFVDAAGAEVVIMPTYVNPNERSGFVYSTDRGATWTSAPNVEFNSSESCIVQIDDTTVRKFVRSGAAQVQYVDYTWNPAAKTFTIVENTKTGVLVPGTRKTTGNQVSAVRYPKLIGGKPVILVSTATGNGASRTNGHIYALSVEPNKTMKVVHDYAIVLEGSNGYSYSSLTVKPDGDIALFYEDSFGGSGWGAGGTSHHTYMNIAKEKVLPDIKDVDINLLVGTNKEIQSMEEVSFNSNPDIVGVTKTEIKANRAQGKRAANKDYNGELQSLSDALYTFTKTGENVYTIRANTGNRDIYLALKGAKTGGNAGFPFAFTPQNITVGYSAEGFTFHDVGSDNKEGWLWFWRNDNNKLHFDRNSKYVNDGVNKGNCDFALYRSVKPGEKVENSAITGYVKLNGMADIEDGGKYLIVSEAADKCYVLRPSVNESVKYDHVLRAEATTVEEVIGNIYTLTGKKVGEATVVIGNTAYHVNVKNYNLFAQLSLQGDIAVNVGYEFAPYLIADDTHVVISVSGKQIGDYKLSEAIQKDNRYVFTLHVDTRQMTEGITVVVKKGETVVGTNVFTVQDYAKIVLASNEAKEAAAHDLVKHMLYYGASMQTYKNYKADALATSILNPDDVKAMDQSAATVTADTLSAYRAVQFEHTTGAKLNAANLDLLSKTTLQFRFDAADFNRTFAEKTGKKVEKRQLPDGSVVVMIPDINAKSLDTMYTLTVDGQEVVQYGPLSYARKVLAGENKPETLKAVVRAMKLYNDAAKAYKPASK